MQGILIIIGIVVVMATTVVLGEIKIKNNGGHSEWLWEIKKRGCGETGNACQQPLSAAGEIGGSMPLTPTVVRNRAKLFLAVNGETIEYRAAA